MIIELWRGCVLDTGRFVCMKSDGDKNTIVLSTTPPTTIQLPDNVSYMQVVDRLRAQGLADG